MRNKTLRFLSKIMCLVLIASFALEAPLFAANQTINVTSGGQSINVTPGTWVTVKNGANVINYNVRYVDGKPVALEMNQYLKLIGNTTTTSATTGATAATNSQSSAAATSLTVSAQAPTTTTTVADNTSAGQIAQSVQTTSTSAADSAVSAAQSGSKTSGSWIKDELNSYGQSIKDNFTAGKESGTTFGNKTSDTVSSGIKTTSTKIGDLLRSAKDRISKIFHKNTTTSTKGSSDQSSQSGQSDQSSSSQSSQSSQSGQSDQTSSSQSSQSSQSGQSDQTGKVSQTEQAGQTTAQTGQTTTQAGQTTQSGAKQTSFLEKTGEFFKTGYSKGKVMANEGVANVKDSLKQGFSPKNLLVTAGITVGVDLVSQILSGEKPSLTKAVKTVCCAEFAGGVVGSVTGAAAGSFFVPFLTAVPVIGGFLSALAPTFGSIIGGSVGSYLAGDIKNGKFSIKDAFKQIDWIGVAGQTVGSTLGAMLGSMIFPPFGTILGGIVGGYLGNKAAHLIAGLFGKDTQSLYDSTTMPVGSNPLTETTSQSSAVTIGTVATSEIPVSGDSTSVAASAESTTIGSYASEVQLAYAKYQELYRLYNEMLAQGRQEDAAKVGTEMNKAKAEYDTLKANSQ